MDANAGGLVSVQSWEEKYRLGIDEIDDQHIVLIAMLDALLLAMQSGQGAEMVLPVLARMRTYAQEHFAVENRYMYLSNYPHVAEHLSLHDSFWQHIAKMEALYEAGQMAMAAVQITLFLKQWLLQHIMRDDRKLVEHVKATTIHRS